MEDKTKKVSNIRLYFHIMGMSLRSRMSFRLDFIVMLISVFLRELASLALLYVVTDRFDTLDGWNKWEIALLYCMVTFCHRMFCSFSGGVMEIFDMVKSGEMDTYMITPRSPLFLINARNTMIWRIYYNIPILIVLIISAVQSGVVFTFQNSILLLVFTVSSVVIMFAMYLIIATISIFVINVETIQNVLSDIITQYMGYPISIYGKVATFILTFIIPLGFVAYYPSIQLLSITQSTINGINYGIITPIVAAITSTFALVFWKYGLKRYNSTGT